MTRQVERVGLLLGILLGVALVAASPVEAGPIFEVRAVDFEIGTSGFVTGAAPVSLGPLTLLRSSGNAFWTAEGTAGQGVLGAFAKSHANGAGTSNSSAALSTSASFNLDDLYFQGPTGGSISVTLHLQLDGSMSLATVNPGGVNITNGGAGILVGVTFQGTAFGFYGIGSQAQFTDLGGVLPDGYGGGAGDISITRVVPTNTPVHLAVELRTSALANVNGLGESSAISSFFDTLSFPVNGPVFDLPEGFTANSVEGLIENNRWTGPVVPEPSALVMSAFLFGMLGRVWSFKRPKRAALTA